MPHRLFAYTHARNNCHKLCKHRAQSIQALKLIFMCRPNLRPSLWTCTYGTHNFNRGLCGIDSIWYNSISSCCLLNWSEHVARARETGREKCGKIWLLKTYRWCLFCARYQFYLTRFIEFRSFAILNCNNRVLVAAFDFISIHFTVDIINLIACMECRLNGMTCCAPKAFKWSFDLCVSERIELVFVFVFVFAPADWLVLISVNWLSQKLRLAHEQSHTSWVGWVTRFVCFCVRIESERP